MTSNPTILSRAPLRWFLFLVAWAVLGVVVSSIVTPRELFAQLPRPAVGSIVEMVLTFYALGFLIPLPVLVCNYLPLGRGPLARALVVHVIAAIAFTLLHYWLVRRSMDALLEMPRAFRGRGRGRGPEGPWRPVIQLARHSLVTLTGYWLVVGVWHALDSARRLREREQHAAALEAQLATARLRALEDQLHPHFLFNTLNTLSSLIYEDVKAADRVIHDLSTLLRLALDNAGRHTVPLAEEVRFVEVYLNIMKTRYPDRLVVTAAIDRGAEVVAVPNLLLQPIVENSIKHGLEATAGTIEIALSARVEGDRLMVEVVDNGPGLPDGMPPREGVGLGNTRNRLEQLYGTDFTFEVANAADGGARVVVAVPVEGGAS